MLKLNLIGLYGSVIQCKRMLEGELSIRMSDLFLSLTRSGERGQGERETGIRSS